MRSERLADLRVIVGYAVREGVRRRVFVVVLGLTVAAGALYAVGTQYAFQDVTDFSGFGEIVDARAVTGATLLGLSMFGALFLGAVLAAFLTLGAVRGDAEQGLLQPLVVRPPGRHMLLAGRLAAAAMIASSYTFAVYAGGVLATGLIGDWWPGDFLLPGLELAGAAALIAALALLGSVFLSGTANGIAVFMLFGGGLFAGLMGQVGDAINSDRLERIGDLASWALPFEALYQRALSGIVSDPRSTTEIVLSLGPLGGAQDTSPLLLLWAAVYGLAIMASAMIAFDRSDLP